MSNTEKIKHDLVRKLKKAVLCKKMEICILFGMQMLKFSEYIKQIAEADIMCQNFWFKKNRVMKKISMNILIHISNCLFENLFLYFLS